MVLQGAAERRLAGDVAGNADRRGVEAGRHDDCCALILGQHRFQHEMFPNDRLRLAVQLADAGTDLLVSGLADVFEEEIDQSPFALQQGQ